MRNKLNHVQAQQVRDLARNGYTHASIARHFGVAQATVTDLINRRTYAHVPDAPGPLPGIVNDPNSPLVKPATNYARKLNGYAVQQVRTLVALGYRVQSIATTFKLSVNTLYAIANRTAWRDVPDVRVNVDALVNDPNTALRLRKVAA